MCLVEIVMGHLKQQNAPIASTVTM